MKRTLIAMMLVGRLFAVTMPAQEGKIAERKENQQKRIANGVKSGQLTAGETAHLETKEARLNKEVRTDRKANGGNLTNNEKKQINQQQNTLSKDIYKDKHNSAVQ
jgi:type II secretory pathway pseudopilin PulG